MYRWKYHCVVSRSVGAGSAATRAARVLSGSVMRLMVPPLPAASRPSNSTTTRAPSSRTQDCIRASSTCSRRSSRSYARFASGLGCLSAIGR